MKHPSDKKLKRVLALEGTEGLTAYYSKYYKLPSASPREQHRIGGVERDCLSYESLTVDQLYKSRRTLPAKSVSTRTCYRWRKL